MQLYCEKCKIAVTFEDNGRGQMICPDCGHEVDRASMPPGSVIQGFKIEYEIGRGTSGAVYKAKQLNLDRAVALKILHHEVSADDEFVDRFFREARAAASLSSPYIVQAIDAGAADGDIYYFAMELIEGENLEEEIVRNNGLSPERGLEIALIVARGMEYAWDRKQLIHGDIKPENILVNEHGEAKLADLGLAKIANDGSDELMATPMYAPPEVISGETDDIGMCSDIYSFGATVYHMFAGHPPFQEDDSEKVMDMHLYDKHEPLADSGDFFSQELSDLVDKMMEKDLHDRPASWHEISESLEHIYNQLDNPNATFKAIKYTPSPNEDGDYEQASNSKRNSLIALAIAIVAGIVTIGMFMVLGNDSSKGNSSAQTSLVKPEKVKDPNEERWTALRKKLDYLDDSRIIAAIKSFNKRYSPSGAVKKELDQVLEETVERYEKKQQVLAEAQRLKDAACNDFLDKIKNLLERMSEVQAGSSHEPSELREMQSLGAKFLKRNSQDKLVAGTMSDEIKKALISTIARLDGRMKVAQARENLINKKVAMLSRELKRRAVLRYKLDAIGRVAGSTSAYFEMLNQVSLALKNGSEVTKLLATSKKLKLGIEQKKNLVMLNKMLVDNGDIKKFFISNATSFIGLTIPGLPGNQSTYKIDKIKESHFVLLRPIGKDSVSGYNKKWSAISPQSKVALAIKGINNSKVTLSDPSDVYLVFGWLLRHKMFGSIDNLLTKIKKIGPGEKVTIVRLMNDVKQAVLERAAWKVLQELLIAEKQQNPRILEMISDMTVQYADTDCYKKNRQVIVMLQQRYSGFGRNNDFIKMYKQYIRIRKKNIPLAVNLAATMSARFSMNKNNYKRIDKVKKNLIANIGRDKSIKGTLPFMKWQLEQLGSSLKPLAKDLGGRGGRGRRGGRGGRGERAEVDPVRFSIEVDNGLWYSSRLAASMKDSKIFEESNFRQQNSESSFATLFGIGIIAYRLGNIEVADRNLQKMIAIVGLTDALKVADKSTDELVKKIPVDKTVKKDVPPQVAPEPPADMPPSLPDADLFPDEAPPEMRGAPPVRNTRAPVIADNKTGVSDVIKRQRQMTMEYALLIKRYGTAELLGRGHIVIADKVSEGDVHIAMLHLLAIIQNSKINPKDAFLEQLSKYNKLFDDKFADDMDICQLVGEILKGNSFSSAIIKKIRLCRDGDTCARMLSAAIACSVFYGNKPYSITKFTALIKKNVSAVFGSGPLWRSLLLLNLADPENSLIEMNNTVKLYKQDWRVVAVYGYPELMIFDAGVVILNGKLPIKMILARMTDSLKNSPVSGRKERFAMRAINRLSLPQMEKYLRELKPPQQLDFGLLFLGLMRLVNEKPADAVEFIARNRGTMFKFDLAWEEKLMIDNIMLWAAAWRQKNMKP